ncbi:MAG: hypothetical protein DMG58_21465 [Acidobacteria bacterium]|nr:MAG: hypothetical protein DMG58_21465 [Acidobacteriota bacterium]
MASAVLGDESKGFLRFSWWDALFIVLALLHGVVLAEWPAAAVIAIGVWWNSNTIAHNFIHRPFFRAHFLNLLFSAYLSMLLGIPQALWRDRHLAHHGGIAWRRRVSLRLVFETLLVLGFWIVLVVRQPRVFLMAYLPGYLAGLALCALQGHYEHVRGATSHYGWIYNVLLFNDGYHAEHHANPGIHWTQLPERIASGAHTSRWPALVRWLDAPGPNIRFDVLILDALEKLVLRSRWLQWFVLRSHRRAFSALVPQLPPVRRVAIVGGGLFPRTALILLELLPGARIVIVDADARNLETARSILGGSVEFLNHHHAPEDPSDCDLMVIPLSFDGDRSAIYSQPPSRAVLVHDWIWHPRGTSNKVVSVALLKRLNLVVR